MHPSSKRQSRSRRIIATLLAVSFVGLLLPTAITGRLMNLVQILVPLQAAASRMTDRVGEGLSDQGPPVAAAEFDKLARQAAALERTVASFSDRIGQLEESNRQLTGIRNRGLGAQGMLIPARLVADDLLYWRDSKLANAGTLRGVQVGTAVTSRSLELDAGSEDGAVDGMAVLAGESLLGWVADCGTHTARVVLLSDPSIRMPVRIGRFEGGEFLLPPTEFWLVGQGQGKMTVIDVNRDLLSGEPPSIQTGDLVLTTNDNPKLPLALTIGKIATIAPNPKNRLLFTLEVEPAAPIGSRDIYLLAP